LIVWSNQHSFELSHNDACLTVYFEGHGVLTVELYFDRRGRMEERAGGGGGSVAAISPVQQMLASGTGALLTSIFGEVMKTKKKHLVY